MSGNSLAMMPWFPRDFIASTLGWRLLERALYRCLLDAQWELGALPTDEEELARIAGATQSEFSSCWPRVKKKFEAIPSGELQNRKLEEHRMKSLQIRDIKREAGRAGGRASAIVRGSRKADVEQMAYQDGSERAAGLKANSEAKTNPPSPSPSPSPNKNTGPAKRRPKVETRFDEIQAVYPKRSGSQRWADAKVHYNARLKEGETHDTILGGVKRYAAFVAASGKAGTGWVQQAATFLGTNKGYLEPWTILPDEKAKAPENKRRAQLRDLAANTFKIAQGDGESEESFDARIEALNAERMRRLKIDVMTHVTRGNVTRGTS